VSTTVRTQTHQRWKTLKPIFFIALFLTSLVNIIVFTSGFWFRGLFLANPTALGNPSIYELYNLTLSLVSILFDPIVLFIVFYRVGSLLDVDVHSRYFGILWFAFSGSWVAGVLSYFIETLLSYTYFGGGTTGFYPAGLYAVTIVFGTARGAIASAFVAFAGILLGYRRRFGMTEAGVVGSGA